jgi:hypothetical protein
MEPRAAEAQPFGLEQLRSKRAQKVLRDCGLARTTIRAQRSDLARIAREWSSIVKRINAALVKYERSIDDLGLSAPNLLRPADLLDCLKGCVNDEQVGKLDEIQAELADHEKQIRAAGKRRAKKRARRAA